MEDYTFLRQFADSWVLLLLFLFFVGVVLWVFRPGSKKIYRDTADIPFSHDDQPVQSIGQAKPAQVKEARDE